MTTVEKGKTSDSVNNHLGLNVFVGNCAVDLP
jgi:hypothetical protein